MNLLFQHLVAKIYIRKITRINSDGSAIYIDIKDTIPTKDYSCLGIRFTQMPQRGIFTTGIGQTEPELQHPMVVADPTAPKGVFVNKQEVILFPPFSFDEAGEIIVYLAKIDSGNLFQTQSYSGNLKDLVGSLPWLKAGEALALDLILTDGKVTGSAAWIVKWNDTANEEVTIPAKKGIYTKDDLLDVINNGNWDDYCEEIDGKKVLRIFNNLNITLKDGTVLDIPDGYILDGLEHNLTCKGLSHLTGM